MSDFDRLHPSLRRPIVITLGWPRLRPLQEAANAPVLAASTRSLRWFVPALRPAACDGGGSQGFCQTETCDSESPVKGERCQSLQRDSSVIPASCAIRSNSDGHT